MMHTHSGSRAARRLVKLARRILPAESREWAAAMEAEMEHVEGRGAALRWAAGCLWVACRQRLAALWGGSPEPVAPPLLAEEVEEAMRKLTLGITIAAVAASLLFLLAPSFRQGLQVQAAGWWGPLNRVLIPAAELRAMAREAQQSNDAETLAFAALFHDDAAERAAWADAAVRRQPELTWLYAAVTARQPGTPESAERLARLRRWAPQNAYVHLRAADDIFNTHVVRGGDWQFRERAARDPQWQEAMAAAFDAPEYHGYLAERFELIRSVMRRRRMEDPLVLALGVAYHRIPDLSGVKLYTDRLLLAADQENQRRGNAAGSVGAVVRFGQRMEAGAETQIERHFAAGLQLTAYERLRAMGSGAGGAAPPAHELQRLEKARAEMRTGRDWRLQAGTFTWSGMVVQVCFLAMALAAGVLILSAVARRSAAAASRLHAAAGVAGACAAVLLFLASVTFYLTYWPYARAYEYFLSAGSAALDLQPLFVFFSLWALPGSVRQLWWQHVIQLAFWYTLIAAGGIAVVWLVARNTRRLGRRAA